MYEFMRDFVASLTGGQRLIAFLVLLLVVALLLAFWTTTNLVAPVLIGTCVVAIIYVTRTIWLPPELSRERVRRYSLYITMVVALAVLSASNPLHEFVITSLASQLAASYPRLGQLLSKPGTPVTLVLVFVWASIAAVNYFMRDKTAMRAHLTPLTQEFPDRNYHERLQLLCEELRDNLDRIDSESNWSHRHFVPLDAEVEILRGERKSRRVMDLFMGIRANSRSRLFLLLGDPGSGKSVALRKLCRILLEEVERTGKVPIYVNLKEWRNRVSWSKQRPPTEEELQEFVMRNLKSRVSLRSRGFIDEYFDRMHDRGRLFLVLDSFDEIPAVLDADETGWLIKELSEVVTRFLVGGNESRGVVASRYFRRPRLTKSDHCVLEIRPFTEIRIGTAIDRASNYPDVLKRALFSDRFDLASIARNPFVLGLLLDYADSHQGALPDNQATLYKSFIGRSIQFAKEELEESNLSEEHVLECATAIAYEMFTSEQYGLEIPIPVLRSQLQNMPIDAVINFLLAARIGRMGSIGGAFSFVHRRFNEYFLVDNFKHAPDRAPLESIPTDSRWRDAMVLYAEVADDVQAREIVSFCVEEIVPMIRKRIDPGHPQYRRTIHSLRFLSDAFRGRRALLSDWELILMQFIRSTFWSDDKVAIKHALEAVGLISEDAAQHFIIEALAMDDDWISETAFHSYRYLSSVQTEAEAEILRYLLSLPASTLLRRYEEISFSLGQSDRFDYVRRRLRLRYLDTLCALAGLFILAITHFFFLIFLVALSLFLELITWVLEGVFDVTMSKFTFHTVISKLKWLTSMAIFILMPLIARGQSGGSEKILLSIEQQHSLWLTEVTLALCFVLFSSTLSYVFDSRRKTFITIHIPYRVIKNAAVLKYTISTLLLSTFFVFYLRINYYKAFKVLETVLQVFYSSFLAVATAVTTIMILRSVYITARRLWADRAKYAEFTKVFGGSRAEIFVSLQNLDTKYFRLQYIEWVERHSRGLEDVLAKADNVWPDGRRPNYQDKASTLLAKMDERWLGFER